MNFTVRKGEVQDMHAVLGLITQLAIYEKEPDAVIITEEDLVRDGFGQHPLFHVFVADTGSEIVGMAFYYFKYSTWKGRCLYLEDFVVDESARRHGVGAELFEAVMEVAHENGVERMEWQVLDWNDPAINFYKKYGANFEDDWLNCRFFKPQLETFFGDRNLISE